MLAGRLGFFFGIRTYLLWLIVVAVVPLLAFASMILWSTGNDHVRQRVADLATTAQLVAASIDRDLVSGRALLEGLAQAPSLKEGDLAEFHQHASLAARPRQAAMSLQAEDGRQLVNTRVPFGRPLPPGANVATRARVFATGEPAISDLFIDSLAQQLTVSVAVPASDGSGERYMLELQFDPAVFAQLLARFVNEPGDSAMVIDGEGRVISRVVDSAASVGRAAPGWQRQAMAGQAGGVLRGRTEDGRQQVIGFARPAQAPGWAVLVARPAVAVDGAWYAPLARLAGIGALMLLAALALAALLARAIVRPVQALTQRAQALTAGEARKIAARTNIREFHRLALATEQAEAAQRERESTERARAVEAAREDANAMFRSFAEAMPDVMWIVVLTTGRLAYLGQAYEGIWGSSREAVVQDLGHWRDSVHPDDRAAFARRLGAIAAGETVDLTYRITRPDGTLRWIRDVGFPLRDPDGTIRRAAGIARDVTAGKDTEERLRVSDTRCTGLIEALGTLAWWSEPSGRMLEQRGQPVDQGKLEHIPVETDWRALVVAEDRAALDACWDRGRAEDAPWQATFRLAWPGQEAHWHLCRAAPIRGADGSVLEWAGVLLDVERPPAEPAEPLAPACGTG